MRRFLNGNTEEEAYEAYSTYSTENLREASKKLRRGNEPTPEALVDAYGHADVIDRVVADREKPVLPSDGFER